MFKRAGPNEIVRARQLRRDATEVEKRLWRKLRDLSRRGYHFRRQSPFHAYTLDFVEHDARLVIELDGGQHGEAAHQSRDAHRDAMLASQGYRTLRFWNLEVVENIYSVFETIIRGLEARRPPPDPLRGSTSPQKGEVER
jgi:very-short-patch-repair endonuclease